MNELYSVEQNTAIFKFLTGERVYLRPLMETDIDGPYPTWLNDEEICQGTSHHVYPYSKRNALEYIQKANGTDKKVVLAILLKDENRHIGNIALQQINWIYRTADLAILIGDKNQWCKGYGSEAAKLMLMHGFTTLNLHRITCATYTNNDGMKKLALSLGMKQEGVRRDAAYKNGRYVDIVEFGLLKEEYQSK